MKKSIVSVNASLKDVLVSINAEPAGISFVVNSNNELKGVITDGDFRRLLLKGRQLSDPIVPSDLGKYVHAMQGESIEELMIKTNKKVRIIPILNSDMEPIDYFRYEHKTHFTPISAPNLAGNELNYVTDAILSTWISSTGSYINKFEEQFSYYSGTQYGVAVSNGTVALHLALVALGIGPGDEVIIPDLTFAATANAVILSGAKPVIVDVELDSWCICPKEINKAISPKTKAIIPVHIYGQPCDMDAIMNIADEHDLYVIEDAAEAHGAEFKNKKVGSFGHISCFSFFANKIITTGEGGICLTNDADLNSKMRQLRDHGMNKSRKYWHDMVGFNYRMTNIQAAIGCAQMERIDDIITERAKLESEYFKILKDCPQISWQKNFDDRNKVVWLVSAIFHGDRAKFIEEMNLHHIDIRPFFYSLSTMPPFKEYAFSNANSAKISEVGFNLPTTIDVDLDKVQKVLLAYLNK